MVKVINQRIIYFHKNEIQRTSLIVQVFVVRMSITTIISFTFGVQNVAYIFRAAVTYSPRSTTTVILRKQLDQSEPFPCFPRKFCHKSSWLITFSEVQILNNTLYFIFFIENDSKSKSKWFY